MTQSSGVPPCQPLTSLPSGAANGHVSPLRQRPRCDTPRNNAPPPLPFSSSEDTAQSAATAATAVSQLRCCLESHEVEWLPPARGERGSELLAAALDVPGRPPVCLAIPGLEDIVRGYAGRGHILRRPIKRDSGRVIALPPSRGGEGQDGR